MLNLFQRELVSVNDRLVLLAPPSATIPMPLRNVTCAPGDHRDFLQQVQRLRGSVYLHDGALRREDLTADGRHETAEDYKSWHLVMTDGLGAVTGCIWYLEHEALPTPQQLRVRDCPLARHDQWRKKFRAAIDREIALARHDSIRCAEVGGWAVACRTGCLSAGLLLILGTYSLSQLAGGAMVLATATVRNSSAKILRRLGGSDLEADGCIVPPYFDPRYGCTMELLRFDTRRPAAKYVEAVQRLKAQFASVPVLATGTPILRRVPIEMPTAPASLPAYAAAIA